MKPIISLGAANGFDILYDRCRQLHNLYQLDQLGDNLDFSIREASGITFLDFLVSPNLEVKSQEYSDCIDVLAEVISEFIINDWEKVLLHKLIDRQAPYSTLEERQKIIKVAIQFLDDADKLSSLFIDESQVDESQGSLIKTSNHRKSYIYQEVLHHLKNNNELVLEGFLRFRLKNYLEELQEAVEVGFTEMQMVKERQDFVRFLRCFISRQESKIEMVHVILRNTSIFEIRDVQGNSIKEDYLSRFLLESLSDVMNNEDLLISALIMIAPQQIIIHSPKSYQDAYSVELLQEIFRGQVILCAGCDYCSRFMER